MNIPNYDLVFTDSDFSRTACYIEKNSDFKLTFSGKGCEVISIENKTQKIIGVYRPFKLGENETLVGNFEKLMTCLDMECRTQKTVVIAGDFNIDLARSTDPRYTNISMVRKLEHWAINHGLSPGCGLYMQGWTSRE